MLVLVAAFGQDFVSEGVDERERREAFASVRMFIKRVWPFSHRKVVRSSNLRSWRCLFGECLSVSVLFSRCTSNIQCIFCRAIRLRLPPAAFMVIRRPIGSVVLLNELSSSCYVRSFWLLVVWPGATFVASCSQ